MTKTFVADVRRRWSEEEKQAIVEESKTSPVARVAKKHGVATSLLFRWRRMQGIRIRKRSPAPPGEREFVRIGLPAPVETSRTTGQSRIEIVLGGGCRVIVGNEVDTTALRRVIETLEGR